MIFTAKGGDKILLQYYQEDVATEYQPSKKSQTGYQECDDRTATTLTRNQQSFDIKL